MHDVTTTGNQTFNGNLHTFSTFITNGGNFSVSGTTTLGDSTTITTGAGNATLTGAVNGATSGTESLTVNSSGATTFGSTIGTTTSLASLTTDLPGTSSFGGSVTVGAGDITINDTATGAGGLALTSNAGQILVNNGSSTFPLTIDTTGAIVISGTSTLGTTGSPVLFTQTPTGLTVINPISMVFRSPTLPGALNFAPGASVSMFLGAGGTAISLAGTAAEIAARLSVSTVQTSAAAAVAEASKAGFDTDSVAQQINYGFAGDVGISPPFEHRIGGVGLSVPDCFGDEECSAEDEKNKK